MWVFDRVDTFPAGQAPDFIDALDAHRYFAYCRRGRWVDLTQHAPCNSARDGVDVEGRVCQRAGEGCTSFSGEEGDGQRVHCAEKRGRREMLKEAGDGGVQCGRKVEERGGERRQWARVGMVHQACGRQKARGVEGRM